jgi:hypothetical protein
MVARWGGEGDYAGAVLNVGSSRGSLWIGTADFCFTKKKVATGRKDIYIEIFGYGWI